MGEWVGIGCHFALCGCEKSYLQPRRSIPSGDRCSPDFHANVQISSLAKPNLVRIPIALPVASIDSLHFPGVTFDSQHEDIWFCALDAL